MMETLKRRGKCCLNVQEGKQANIYEKKIRGVTLEKEGGEFL